MQIDLQVPHRTVCGRSGICIFNRLLGKHSRPRGEGPQRTLCKDERGGYGIEVPGSASPDSEQVALVTQSTMQTTSRVW